MVKRRGASRPPAEQIEVLVIDDEPSVRSVVTDALAADGYLVKPFSTSEIRQIVRNVLRGKSPAVQ